MITGSVHCVKSDQIRSFFWFEYGKIRTEKNSVFGHFSPSDLQVGQLCAHPKWT